jgi:hypothetical protein
LNLGNTLRDFRKEWVTLLQAGNLLSGSIGVVLFQDLGELNRLVVSLDVLEAESRLDDIQEVIVRATLLAVPVVSRVIITRTQTYASWAAGEIKRSLRLNLLDTLL